MTVVGCYAMDLYCDHPKHVETYKGPPSYEGYTRGECVREARKDGWIFHRDGNLTCPKCSPLSHE
jgi:hypothetical protein